MGQSTFVWFIIVLALLTANLPFAVERHLLWLPWQQAADDRRHYLARWLTSLLHMAVLVGVAYFFYQQIGDALSTAWFGGFIVAYLAACALLLVLPGWRMGEPATSKPFAVRLLEVFVLYCLCGVLAMAIEQNQGNRFAQTWEFYAITGSLYVVLGYPGFVLRYLLRKPRRSRTRQPAGQGNASSGTVAPDAGSY